MVDCEKGSEVLKTENLEKSNYFLYYQTSWVSIIKLYNNINNKDISVNA